MNENRERLSTNGLNAKKLHALEALMRADNHARDMSEVLGEPITVRRITGGFEYLTASQIKEREERAGRYLTKEPLKGSYEQRQPLAKKAEQQ